MLRLHPDSIGFITYYAARGVNYRVPPDSAVRNARRALSRHGHLDLAGLPLSDSHKERKRLMDLCKGRYNGCKKRDEILVFHRRLIISGILAARQCDRSGVGQMPTNIALGKPRHLRA